MERLAARLGVSYRDFKKELKKHGDHDLIVIEDEFRRDWVDMFVLSEPLEEQTHLKTPCAKRKLMPKPKYWFAAADAFGNPIP